MIFFEHRISEESSNRIEFNAIVNGVSEGKCTLILKSDIAEITEIFLQKKESFLIEGLIKAAFNFAANRNYYMGICSASGIDEYLDRMNFVKNEYGYSNDIPTILMGSCKGCQKE